MIANLHSRAMYTETHKLDVLWANATDTENWALNNFADNPDHSSWQRVNELYAAYEAAKDQYRVEPEDDARFDAMVAQRQQDELALSDGEIALTSEDYY